MIKLSKYLVGQVETTHGDDEPAEIVKVDWRNVQTLCFTPHGEQIWEMQSFDIGNDPELTCNRDYPQ